MKLSIVIPVLNEASGLPDLLEHLRPLRQTEVEVIVVDGGSSDDTAALAGAAGLYVVEASSGRARQMNVGAQASTGDALLFLHADTRLPQGALTAMSQALRKRTWGRFDVVIVDESPLLRLVAAMMNGRSRLSGIATGDQGLFMTRQAFESVGGFPEQPLMEDIDMCRALKQMGRPACLSLKVATSGRRWRQRGIWRTILTMWWLRWRYWLGASAEDMARQYR